MRLSWVMWLGIAGSAWSAEPDPVLVSWIQAQTNLHSWKAEVVQTRTWKTLAQPLTARGRVWFSAPNRFRWELGTPPDTIAVRETNALVVVYPRLKRAERYRLDGPASGPWKASMALLEAGFHDDLATLESRFRVLEVRHGSRDHTVVLEPRAPAARRLTPRIEVAFSKQDFQLTATELVFSDGSTMRNEFHGGERNVPLDPALFSATIESDYKVIETAWLRTEGLKHGGGRGGEDLCSAGILPAGDEAPLLRLGAIARTLWRPPSRDCGSGGDEERVAASNTL